MFATDNPPPIFASEAGANRSRAPFKCSTICRNLLALTTDIGHGWKGLPGTHTLAYFTSPSVIKKISFMILTPGANVIKLFTVVIYEHEY